MTEISPQRSRRAPHYRLAAAACLAAALAGCRIEAADLPMPRGWRVYTNETLGVALEVPDYLTVNVSARHPGTVFFRFHGGNAVLLRWADEEESERRGLWVGSEPLGAITMGGRAGQRYDYRHHDGPVYSITSAYVVPHRGKELALEFRTQHDEEIRGRMVASVRFLD